MEITLPLWEIIIHMGSHSVVTCHSAAVTFLPLPQPKLVLDLATPGDAKLSWPGWWLYSKIVYLPKTVIYLRNNQAVSRPGIEPATFSAATFTESRKSNILTTTPPSHLKVKVKWNIFFVEYSFLLSMVHTLHQETWDFGTQSISIFLLMSMCLPDDCSPALSRNLTTLPLEHAHLSTLPADAYIVCTMNIHSHSLFCLWLNSMSISRGTKPKCVWEPAWKLTAKNFFLPFRSYIQQCFITYLA